MVCGCVAGSILRMTDGGFSRWSRLSTGSREGWPLRALVRRDLSHAVKKPAFIKVDGGLRLHLRPLPHAVVSVLSRAATSALWRAVRVLPP